MGIASSITVIVLVKEVTWNPRLVNGCLNKSHELPNFLGPLQRLYIPPTQQHHDIHPNASAMHNPEYKPHVYATSIIS
jgi:hypothetical protein